MAMAGSPGEFATDDAAAMPEDYDPAMPEGYDPAMVDGYANPGGNRQPKMSDRPDDYKKWTAEHFAKAVEERDPRLLDAINTVSEDSKGNPQVAAQLTALLELVARMPETVLIVPPQAPGANSSGAPAGFPPDSSLPGSDPASIDPAAVDPAESGNSGSSFEQPQGALDSKRQPTIAGGAVFTRSLLLAPLLATYQAPLGSSDSSDPAAAAFSNPADPAMPEGYRLPGPVGIPGGTTYGAEGRTNSVRSAVDKGALIRAILRGLVKNDTAEAWQTIEKLLKGELGTGLGDAEAVDFVLALLIQNYGGKDHPTHQLLSRVLNEPETLRPQIPGATDQLSAASLQHRAIQLHARFAASATDVLLGISAIGSKSATPSPVAINTGSRPPRQAFGNSQFSGNAYAPLEGADPAAVAIDDAGALPGEDPAAAYVGSPPEGAFPGGPPPAPVGGAGPGTSPAGPGVPNPDFGAPGQFQPVGANVSVSLDEEELTRVVAYLWQSDVPQVVTNRMQKIDKLGRDVEILTLAASLPTPSVRSGLYELFHAHWQDGAGGLSSQGFFENAAHDPGLHVVVKSLPRERPRISRARAARADEHADAKASWLKASEQLLRTLNTRMFAAGRKTDATDAAVTKNFPVTLHTGAQVLVDYQLRWPDDVRARTGGVDLQPMQLRYLRMEQNGNANVVSRHYERELVGAQKHILPNVTWYDKVGPGGLPGSTRSVDVVVNSVGDRKYLVQILEIVIPDPSTGAE